MKCSTYPAMAECPAHSEWRAAAATSGAGAAAELTALPLWGAESLLRTQRLEVLRTEDGAAPPPLLAALARLLRGAPPAVARAHLPAVLPWLLAGLAAAGRSGGPHVGAGDQGSGGREVGWSLAADQAAVDALLATLGEALQDASGMASQEHTVIYFWSSALQHAFHRASVVVQTGPTFTAIQT